MESNLERWTYGIQTLCKRVQASSRVFLLIAYVYYDDIKKLELNIRFIILVFMIQYIKIQTYLNVNFIAKYLNTNFTTKYLITNFIDHGHESESCGGSTLSIWQ